MHRSVKWPPQKTIQLEMDKVQRKMMAIAQGLAKRLEASLDEYFRRRQSAAGAIVRKDPWSRKWFKRSIAWDKLVARDAEAQKISVTDPKSSFH